MKYTVKSLSLLSLLVIALITLPACCWWRKDCCEDACNPCPKKECCRKSCKPRCENRCEAKCPVKKYYYDEMDEEDEYGK